MSINLSGVVFLECYKSFARAFACREKFERSNFSLWLKLGIVQICHELSKWVIIYQKKLFKFFLNGAIVCPILNSRSGTLQKIYIAIQANNTA